MKALVAFESGGPPFENLASAPFDPAYIRPAANRNRPFGLTLLPIAYEPAIGGDASLLVRQNVSASNADLSSCILQAAPARKLANFSKVPVLFVTAEASYHAVYEHCTVAFLRQGGVVVECSESGKVGIHGTGHFMFIEFNNLIFAEVVEGCVGRWFLDLFFGDLRLKRAWSSCSTENKISNNVLSWSAREVSMTPISTYSFSDQCVVSVAERIYAIDIRYD